MAGILTEKSRAEREQRVRAVVAKLAHEVPELANLDPQTLEKVARVAMLDDVKGRLKKAAELECIDYQVERELFIERASKTGSSGQGGYTARPWPAWKPGAQSRVFPRWNSVLPGPTTGLRARRRKAGPHRRCGCIWRRPPRYGPGWGDGTPSYVILSGGPGPVQRASLRERRQSPLPWRFESLRPRRNPSFGLLSS